MNTLLAGAPVLLLALVALLVVAAPLLRRAALLGRARVLLSRHSGVPHAGGRAHVLKAAARRDSERLWAEARGAGRTP